VRLITGGGYNWTDRYPWIVEAARKIRQKRFVLDGEAVACQTRRPRRAGPGQVQIELDFRILVP
jgi:ATP-dependent DNA ligase